MRLVTSAPQRDRVRRRILPLTVWLLLPIAAAAQELSPDSWFYEIDGDYGSEIADVVPDVQPADEIKDGGVTTWANRENCSNWEHIDRAPYMGQKAYTVRCVVNQLTEGIRPPVRRRSEQHFLQGWRASEDSARHLSMAIRLRDVPATPTSDGGGWIAQLHGEGLPFNLVWVATRVAKPGEGMPEPGYYLWAGAKYDERQPDGTYEPRQPYKNLGRLTPDTWIRVWIHIDLGKGHRECPGAIGDDAFWSVARMDNATGLWGEPVRYDGQMGNPYYEGTRNCLKYEDSSYNFKIGQYVVATTHNLDFDNVAYGKRWSNITKNRLIGYRKSVLRLPFEESSGGAVQDRSYTFNGGSAGDPISDYDNNGKIIGHVTRLANGVNGRALRFAGRDGSYVKVPIGANVVDDFDVGNYMTASLWFRTTATPAENKGLVMIDEFSDAWKLLLYMRGNGIAFGVRHPGTYSRLDHEFALGRYADKQWHLVTGTYNRFAPDGRRIKLYIDGQKVMEAAGADLPILRGDHQLVVGKYSVNGFFEGDIDDVGLFNYTMTDAEVQSLWRKRGAP